MGCCWEEEEVWFLIEGYMNIEYCNSKFEMKWLVHVGVWARRYRYKAKQHYPFHLDPRRNNL